MNLIRQYASPSTLRSSVSTLISVANNVAMGCVKFARRCQSRRRQHSQQPSSVAPPLSGGPAGRMVQKVMIDQPGQSYDRLVLRDVPAQANLGPDEVRVATCFAGINYADCCVRYGFYESAKKYKGYPICPGFEFSGRVTELGSNVSPSLQFNVGTEVFGVTRFDGYASEVVVPRAQVFPLPQGMTLAQAAGFPAVFLTAWFGLVELVRLRPGMQVLIHSAAGGVGGAMVQLAVAAGCTVTGVVGASHKVEFVRTLGAHHVIDKSREDLWAAAERVSSVGFEIVADANGVETLQQSYDHLAQPGRLLVYGFHTMLPKSGERLNWFKLVWAYLCTPRFSPLEMTGQNRSVICYNLSYLFDQLALFSDGMEFLLRLWHEGKLHAPHVTEFDVKDVQHAHRAIESGQTMGKLVLRFSEHVEPAPSRQL
jgi:NADPH:quinone reductase-like Zn-dependent oxidoreductase